MTKLWTMTVMTAAVTVVMAPVVSMAQQAPDGWTVPRTPDGRPDLQGVWANDSATPFQRPEALGDRATLTDEEVAAFRAHAAEYDRDGSDAVFGDSVFLRALASVEEAKETKPGAATPARRSIGSYNQFWMIDRWFDNRTSLIVDPPHGRLPPRTSEAEARAERSRAARSGPEPTGPLTLEQELARIDPNIRCRGGRPVLSGRGYNSNYQIFQTSDVVAIRMEMYHETRFISVGDAVPGQVGLRSAMGSSRGRWEGDTLVVETTNLTGGTNGSTRDVRVTERFSRAGPQMLQYEYTVEDPATWTEPWTARMFMRPAPGTGIIYEFACHEGNYAIEHALRNARFEDAEQSR